MVAHDERLPHQGRVDECEAETGKQGTYHGKPRAGANQMSTRPLASMKTEISATLAPPSLSGRCPRKSRAATARMRTR